MAWGWAYVMAAVLAGGLVYGVISVYDYVVRMTSSGRVSESPDLAMETKTRIGQVTNIQQSKSIRWQYDVEKGEKPERLRLAAYNWTLGNDWRAQFRTLDYVEQIAPEREAGGDFEKLLSVGEAGYVFDEADLERDEFEVSGRLIGLLTNQSVLPMALGTRGIEGVEAGSVAANSMGTTQVNQPEHGAVSLRLSGDLEGVAGELDPSDRDLAVPVHEEEGLDQFLKRLGWEGLSLEEPPWAEAPPNLSAEEARELEHRLRMEFATKFKYSTFSDFSRSSKPISDFLNVQPVGHCEYFASATTMLMRRVAVPARYCVGFVVREQGEDENPFENTPGNYPFDETEGGHQWKHWDGDSPMGALKEFNAAFVGLVGRQEELSEEDMQHFTDFALALTPPPNPIRNLDNSLTPQQQAGRNIYFDVNNITGIGSCNHCHELDPAQKKFGTGGKMSFEGGRIAEDFKVPHLRNAYSKVGMFGSSSTNSDATFMGDQVRGFGYLHDGAIDTLDSFFKDPVFKFPAPVASSRADVIRFVMAVDSNFAPVVGQQVTLRGDSPWTFERLTLLEERAQVTAPRAECLLMGAGVIDGQRRVLRMNGPDSYQDTEGVAYTSTQLRDSAQTSGQELTFTCYPPG